MSIAGVYGDKPLADLWRATRAIATNQLARFMPAQYVMLTGETGRGQGAETEAEVAEYFIACSQEYLQFAGVAEADTERFLAGKTVLEYGPGDIPAVGLWMLAKGAQTVVCVDRFPLVKLDARRLTTIQEILNRLSAAERQRAMSAFVTPGDPSSGFNPARLRYVIDGGSGLSGMKGTADLVLSRAVLEHVNDLEATFADARAAVAPTGKVVHLVDLRSHGLHRNNRLDFLTWPEWLWRAMYGFKGAPNRLRIDAYRAAAQRAGFSIDRLEVIGQVSPAELQQVRPYLASRFRKLSEEDLLVLQFWIVCTPRT
jgi:SAM-dependent methyltransferase